jgi:hypothetical protein
VEQFGKWVESDIEDLQAFMNKNMEKAKASGKIAQNVKEFGLNLISQALGVETPSLKNCEQHLKEYKVSIGKAEIKSHDLSKEIYHAMDEEEAFRKKLAAAKDRPVDDVRKAGDQTKKVEKTLHNLIESTIKVNQSIEKAKVRHKEFEAKLAKMKVGVSGWAAELANLTWDLASYGVDFQKQFETSLKECAESEKLIGDVLNKA